MDALSAEVDRRERLALAEIAATARHHRDRLPEDSPIYERLQGELDWAMRQLEQRRGRRLERVA